MPATNPTFRMISPAFYFPFQPPYSVHAMLLFAALWTVACQAPLSVRFSTERYWSGLLPGEFPGQAVRPESFLSPALTGGFFTTRGPYCICAFFFKKFAPCSLQMFQMGYSLHINILIILYVNNATSFDIIYCTFFFFFIERTYYFSFQFWHLAWELEETGGN